MKKRVFIIAGGYGVNEFDLSLLKNEDVIVVNKSIEKYINAKYFVTMDITLLRKIDKNIFNSFNGDKVFIVNLAPGYMQDKAGCIIDSKFNITYELDKFDVILKSRAERGVGFSYSDFRNGANSGYCALQFAIIQGYEEIYLLGYDLDVKGISHFHGGYGEDLNIFSDKLKFYRECFDELFNGVNFRNIGIDIYSCSKNGYLNKYLRYKDFSIID
jgi:hypothetical protein